MLGVVAAVVLGLTAVAVLVDALLSAGYFASGALLMVDGDVGSALPAEPVVAAARFAEEGGAVDTVPSVAIVGAVVWVDGNSGRAVRATAELSAGAAASCFHQAKRWTDWQPAIPTSKAAIVSTRVDFMGATRMWTGIQFCNSSCPNGKRAARSRR